MTCPNCGSANEAGRKFCGECGTRLATVCPNCGSTNGPGVRFCGECGHKFASGATGAVGEPHVVDVGTGPGPPTATAATERRLVSVLFADLVGFTAAAEGRDPEEVRAFLSRYFDVARDVIERYGGTVEKFIGDAVMAVWGTPVALEDDAERSVRAALDLVDAVRRLGDSTGMGALDVRAGVLTGEAAVTVGATGQGMVAGDLVNTASRLQSVAPPGTVLVGAATHRAASGAILFEPAGEQLLKGKTAPVPAWRALRVVAERGGGGRSEGIEPPFVGRDDELQLIKDVYHAVTRERRARLISVTGVAGIGKSRLAWEFLKYIDGLRETVRWHQGRSPAYGEGVTFWALGEMVRRRAGTTESDTEDATRAGIATAVADYVPDESARRRIESALLFLLGIGEAPPGGRDELFAAWRSFFEHVAETAPGTILVFEDLHWADSGLLDFIDYLLDWARSLPILVVTLARPELLDRRPDWGAGRRSFLAMALEPLAEPAMQRLLNELAPDLPEAPRATILARAGGIPLYAVETVRMLAAESKLVEEDGAYRLVGELGELHVPESLHALIAARLDALSQDDRSLLQDAAVLGQTFSTAALAALTGRDPVEIETRLQTLARREIVTRDTDPRSPERGQFGFTQALIREVAYGTLALGDRRARHLAAARYFESLGDEELAGVLATHYVSAQQASPAGPEADAVAAQARIALRAAAERAAALGSHDQAVNYLKQAIALTHDESEQAALLEQAGRSASRAGRHVDAERSLSDALERQRSLGETQAIARVTAALAASRLHRSDIEGARRLLEPAIAEFADLSSRGPVEIAAELARAYFYVEDVPGTLAACERALEAAERLDLVDLVADLLVTKGSMLAFAGRSYEGLGVLEAGLRLADAQGLTDAALRARTNVSNVLAIRDPAAGFRVAREGLEAARRLGQRSPIAYLASNAAICALRLGEWDWIGANLSDSAMTDLEPEDRLVVVQYRSFVSSYRGEPQDDVAEAEALAARRTEPQTVADDLRIRGIAAFAQGNLPAAYEELLASAAASSSGGPVAIGDAARIALIVGDLERARHALDLYRARNFHGAAIDVEIRTIEAGVHALEGRVDAAVAAYREAWQGWRDLGCKFDLALAELSAAAVLGAGNGDVAAVLPECREILSRLRARPLLERLDSIERAEGAERTAGDGRAAATTGRETAVERAV